MNTQNTLNNNQYPKSITEANNVLSNHPHDNYKSKKQSQGDKKKGQKEDTKPKASESKSEEKEEFSLSFAQMQNCYICGKPGHISPNCQFKDRPKSEWAINKVQQQKSNESNQQHHQPCAGSSSKAKPQGAIEN